MGNNVPNLAAFHIDVILPGDTCVSPVQLNRALFHKLNICPT
jgi:hypothetical protein